MKRTAIFVGSLVAIAATAYAASPIKVSTDNGDVIAGSNSYKTLYTYAKDSKGKSNCSGECAKKWPPHLAKYWDSPRPPFGTTKRADGKAQWSLHGMPLYFSTLDKKKGDTNGDGVDGLWKAARP